MSDHRVKDASARANRRRGLIILVAVSICCLRSSSSAEPMMQVSAPNDEMGMYSQLMNTTTTDPFEVAVVLDSDGHEVSRVQFTLTDLKLMYPGVLRLGVQYPTSASVNALEASEGRYDISFGGCAPACETLEVVRVTYLDIAGQVGEVVMEIVGPGPDESAATPIIYDCQTAAFAAPMGGPDATPSPIECNNEPIPPGALWINGICLLRSMESDAITPYAVCAAIVEVGEDSVGMLKSRY